jgi:phytoene dehydrogenase-like protein
MTSVSQAQADVIVIGAGPPALLAAAQLVRTRAPARVVERRPTPH